MATREFHDDNSHEKDKEAILSFVASYFVTSTNVWRGSREGRDDDAKRDDEVRKNRYDFYVDQTTLDWDLITRLSRVKTLFSIVHSTTHLVNVLNSSVMEADHATKAVGWLIGDYLGHFVELHFRRVPPPNLDKGGLCCRYDDGALIECGTNLVMRVLGLPVDAHPQWVRVFLDHIPRSSWHMACCKDFTVHKGHLVRFTPFTPLTVEQHETFVPRFAIAFLRDLLEEAGTHTFTHRPIMVDPRRHPLRSNDNETDNDDDDDDDDRRKRAKTFTSTHNEPLLPDTSSDISDRSSIATARASRHYNLQPLYHDHCHGDGGDELYNPNPLTHPYAVLADDDWLMTRCKAAMMSADAAPVTVATEQRRQLLTEYAHLFSGVRPFGIITLSSSTSSSKGPGSGGGSTFGGVYQSAWKERDASSWPVDPFFDKSETIMPALISGISGMPPTLRDTWNLYVRRHVSASVHHFEDVLAAEGAFMMPFCPGTPLAEYVHRFKGWYWDWRNDCRGDLEWDGRSNLAAWSMIALRESMRSSGIATNSGASQQQQQQEGTWWHPSFDHREEGIMTTIDLFDADRGARTPHCFYTAVEFEAFLSRNASKRLVSLEQGEQGQTVVVSRFQQLREGGLYGLCAASSSPSSSLLLLSQCVQKTLEKHGRKMNYQLLRPPVPGRMADPFDHVLYWYQSDMKRVIGHRAMESLQGWPTCCDLDILQADSTTFLIAGIILVHPITLSTLHPVRRLLQLCERIQLCMDIQHAHLLKTGHPLWSSIASRTQDVVDTVPPQKPLTTPNQDPDVVLPKIKALFLPKRTLVPALFTLSPDTVPKDTQLYLQQQRILLLGASPNDATRRLLQQWYSTAG